MNLINPILPLFHKLFTLEKWNIGYVYQTPENLIHSKKLDGEISWLRECSADEAADPFVININGNKLVYYEEHSFWKGRGELMMMDKLNFKNKKKICGITPNSIHLSYPYLFTVKDKLYCIPETSAAKQIALYQVDKDNPQKFKKIRILLQGDKYVDSSIIFYQDKYWLFTSVSGKPGELHIFYSDTLLTTFKAHALNPIVVDAHTSRSAGRLFIVDEKLYMPSQNPEKGYGGSIMINEITHITETEFQYRTDFELLPQSPYDRGLHTINFAEGLLIVDGKRSVRSVLNPLKKIVLKIRKRKKAAKNV